MSKVLLEKPYRPILIKRGTGKRFKNTTFYFNGKPHRIEANRMVPILVEPEEGGGKPDKLIEGNK